MQSTRLGFPHIKRAGNWHPKPRKGLRCNKELHWVWSHVINVYFDGVDGSLVWIRSPGIMYIAEVQVFGATSIYSCFCLQPYRLLQTTPELLRNRCSWRKTRGRYKTNIRMTEPAFVDFKFDNGVGRYVRISVQYAFILLAEVEVYGRQATESTQASSLWKNGLTSIYLSSRSTITVASNNMIDIS